MAVAGSAVAQITTRDFCNRGVARQKKGDLDGAMSDYTRAIELNPQNSLAYNNRALVDVAKGDLEAALADYDRALKISPRNFEIRTNRGVVKQKLGDVDGALADYNRAIELYHKYGPARRNRATIKLARNDIAGALDDCNWAIEVNSKDAAAYNLRGLIAAAKGNLDAARTNFSQAAKLDPKYARSNPPAPPPATSPVVASQPAPSTGPVVAPTESPRPEPASKNLDAAKGRSPAPRTEREMNIWRPEPDFAPPIEVEPKNIAAAYDRDVSKRQKENHESTAANQKAAVEPTPNATAKATEIPITTQVGPAAPEPGPAIELASKNSQTSSSVGLATANATDLGDRTASNSPPPESTKSAASIDAASPKRNEPDMTVALADRNRATEPQKSPAPAEPNLEAQKETLNAPPTNTPPPEREPNTPSGFYNRAQFRKTIGDLTGAMMDYTRAIQLDGKYAAAYNGRGTVKRAKHDLDGALADYNRAIELNGGNAFVYYNRGLTKQNKGDIDGALADFNPAIQLDPRNAAAYQSRGAVKAMKGDLDGAMDDYTRAIELDPKDAAIYTNRADLRFSSGKWNAALEDYNRVFELSKDGQEYPRLYVWLIRARTGHIEEANKELTNYLQQRANTGDWYSQVASYLLDKIPEDKLLAAAKSADTKKEAGQLCEGWFYVGMKKLISGDKNGAKDCFNKSLATRQKDYAEYHFAQAEVSALRK